MCARLTVLPFHPPGTEHKGQFDPPPTGQAWGPIECEIGQQLRKADTDEADDVIDAIAKTVAELTSQQDGLIRQQVIEQLMRQIKICTTTRTFGVKTRSQSALMRSTEECSGRVEQGTNSPHPHAGQAGGSLACSQRSSARQLQNIRLGSAAANPLSRSQAGGW